MSLMLLLVLHAHKKSHAYYKQGPSSSHQAISHYPGMDYFPATVQHFQLNSQVS